ncbi:P-loop containing nucleoside triphosphate hydrolase protein [Truncatella angustata]|uniref:RNA helicase n=1 Tax=Truncatella angustata TaxID=152316 RepID=A0A9P8UYU0_9PEZI|nr:P-loop containing nucleoside triphosphate hydrolase protein [Truncatella angustata]KAH6660419.1 P-loop containing nucleoside triphosphate hydrolase protein [Truncatella angustata]
MTRVDNFIATTGSWQEKKAEYQSFGIDSILDYDREAGLFKTAVDKSCELASTQNAISRADNPLFWSLRNAFVQGDIKALSNEIKYAFYNFLMRARFSKNITATHKNIADFRYPYEWFPATRALQRTIHMHVGPTNSGKTYNALKALENAKSGVYAGPLRLLAHEVYSRFTAKGKNCALITGEEMRIPDVDNYFRSCTVEMTPLNFQMDVAVIDEIQMIGDEERGWAWTQAVLGVQAKEVHLCGEERAVELIRDLCRLTGDKVEIHRYERLSPLEAMDKSLGSLKQLEKGDAVVSFSRVGIHALKTQIEKATGKRCAIVYGGLPPETRAQQAALFNDPNNDYDFLAASDAIGMGLNLEIKRIVFEATHKRNKFGYAKLSVSDIKQIGGRAGRYRTAQQAVNAGVEGDKKIGGPPPAPKGQIGLVTAMEDEDLDNIQRAFTKEPQQIKSAGIQVPPSVLERFSTYFPPNTPFSYIILRIYDIARITSRFHMCNLGEIVEVADLIQEFPMSVYDRCVFLNAPVFLRESNGPRIVKAFAKCVSDMGGGYLLDIPEIELGLLDTTKDTYVLGANEYLRKLEALHKTITLYLWLSYRYSGVFRSQSLAFHVKEMVETKINQHLGEMAVSEKSRRAMNAKIRKQTREQERKKKTILGEDGRESDQDSDRPGHEGPGEWNEEGHEEPLFQDPAEVQVSTKTNEKTTV